MKDSTYHFLLRIVDKFIWQGAVLNVENLPNNGPAVFVCNHLGANGPIGVICSIHLRFYPWIIADMLDKNLAPDYLRVDFVEPSLGLKPPLSAVIAQLISFISVPMLTSMGSISVNRKQYADLQDSLVDSVNLLKQGRFLLIFPEEPELDLSPLTKMKPFMKGFTRLGDLYYAETGQELRFYPLAIHLSKKVVVGKPLFFHSDRLPAVERPRLKNALESEIIRMYLEIENSLPHENEYNENDLNSLKNY